MKKVKQIIFLLAGLMVLPVFASEQTVCKGNIKVTKAHKTMTTRSGHTFVTADIKVDEKTFSCKGLNKHQTKGMFDDILKKKTSLELNIEKQYFKTGAYYEAEYVYPEDFWYLRKRLSSKTLTKKTKRKGLTKYTGSLFSVKYPSSFTAKPLKPYNKKYKLVKTDEATFLSPDKEVAFFVYSPHWSGEPKNYHKVAKSEVLVSKELKESYPKKNRRISIRYATIKAKNGSYTRSYAFKLDCTLDTNGHPDSCQSDTFGIKYKNKKAYDKYKKTYIKFKRSLKKYAAS